MSCSEMTQLVNRLGAKWFETQNVTEIERFLIANKAEALGLLRL